MKWMQWLTNWFGGTTKSLGSLGVGLRAALSGAAPGGWASDHREETAHNTGFNYVAIHAIAAQVAGATVTVFADGENQTIRQAKRKSLARCNGTFARWKSAYGAEDRETDPLPATHPLVRLLKRPNPYESGASFRYRQTQQIRLTGTCLIWNVPSRSGPTCERYVIPTAMASPVAPTLELPRGGWRINPVASRYTPIVDDGYVDCPSWYRILGQIVDARQVQMIRLPHAWYLDDGQSPLSAGARWVDAGEAVDTARYHQLKNGIDPSVVWNLPPDVSPDQDEIDRVQAKISAKYGGPENVGRVMVAQSGTSITPLSTTPKDMCYTEGFHDFKAAILALHQTPPVAVGLQEPGAYAAYNASMKAWRHAAVQPLCDMLAESDTEHLAPQFGIGLTIEIESDTVDDTELIETQLRNDLAARVRTRNEWRAVRGMPPLPGSQGDELVGADSGRSSSTPSNETTRNDPPATGTLATRPTGGATPTNTQVDQQQLPESSTHALKLPAFQQSRVPIGERLKADVAKGSEQAASHDADKSDFSEQEFRARLIAEILYGVFGPAALRSAGLIGTAKSFDPEKHPRDELGRFTNTGTDEEIANAKKVISAFLKDDRNASNAEDLAKHLSVLKTSTLITLHKDHGVVAPPQHRNDLVRSLWARSSYSPIDTSLRDPKGSKDTVHVYIQKEEECNDRLLRGTRSKKGPDLTNEQWKDLVGAQPGSRVYVFPTYASQIEIFVDHPDYRAKRVLFGNGEIENVEIKVSPQKQKAGIATRALVKQVQTATKLGFTSIIAGGAGWGDGLFAPDDFRPHPTYRRGGYYTWPRLGFTGDVRSIMNERLEDEREVMRASALDFFERFPRVRNIAQLMNTEKGRRWWKAYGSDIDLTFDLSKGSLSRRTLARYIAERRAESRKHKAHMLRTVNGPAEPRDMISVHNQDWIIGPDSTVHRSNASWQDWEVPDGENPDILSPEDEAILDRIWDQIGKEFPETENVPEPATQAVPLL